MKIKSIILTVFVLCTFAGFSQGCDKLLEGGLYSFTTMTNTGSFSKDIRTYYLSEQFKSDMRSGKWGASLTIPIKKVPFTIGMNDSNERFSQLRTKLLEVSELNISEDLYQTAYSTIPNTNLYEAYLECKKIPVGQTGFIQGLNIETDDTVVFTIYYRPSSPNDPMPIVTDFNVTPKNSILSGNISTGQALNSYTILVTCKKHEEKDLVLTLQTDRGAFSTKAPPIDNIASSKEFPIGTIITSYLNFDQFNLATKNNERSPGGIWTSQKSKWAPCDGRPVPQSKFQKLTSTNNIPDLRGMFMRGLNKFDPYQPVPEVSTDKADPDSRVVGSYQKDMVGPHTHNFSYTTSRNEASNGGGHGHKVSDSERSRSGTTNASTGVETRPKNIAVFYYIKIN